MAEQMFGNIKGRSKFTQVKPRNFKGATALLTQCGFDSWRTVSKLTEETAKYLRGIFERSANARRSNSVWPTKFSVITS